MARLLYAIAPCRPAGHATARNEGVVSRVASGRVPIVAISAGSASPSLAEFRIACFESRPLVAVAFPGPSRADGLPLAAASHPLEHPPVHPQPHGHRGGAGG